MFIKENAQKKFENYIRERVSRFLCFKHEAKDMDEYEMKLLVDVAYEKYRLLLIAEDSTMVDIDEQPFYEALSANNRIDYESVVEIKEEAEKYATKANKFFDVFSYLHGEKKKIVGC